MEEEQDLSQNSNLEEDSMPGNLTSPVQLNSEPDIDEEDSVDDVKELERNNGIIDKKATSTYSFQPESYVINDKFMLLGLKNDETLCFTGATKLSVLKGSVSIANFRLESCYNQNNPEKTQLRHYYAYSAKTYPILKIVANISEKEPSSGFKGDYDSIEGKDPTEVKRLLEVLRSWGGLKIYDTVLRLESLAGTNFDKVEHVHPNYKNIFKLQSESDFQPITGFYPVLKPTCGITTFNDDGYKEMISQIVEFSPEANDEFHVMVFGQKDQGKSTFLKLLLNPLLNQYKHVAYLNLDPGQTEFDPPGMLSLHLIKRPVLGPNFTQLRQPTSCYYLGETSYKFNPFLALKLIDRLFLDFKQLKKEYGTTLPLLINTSGWVLGQGSEILTHIAASLPITFPILLGDNVGVKVDLDYFNVPCYKPEGGSAIDRTAVARRRNLMVSSYLHLQPNTDFDALPLKWDFSHITTRPPHIANWSLFELWLLHCPCKLSKVMVVLNCALVAIYAPKQTIPQQLVNPPSPTVNLNGDSEDKPNVPKLVDTVQYIYFDPTEYDYLGLALIRAVDVQQSQLHLLTPIPTEKLTQRYQGELLLVKGDLSLPQYHYHFPNCEQQISNRQALGLPKLQSNQFTLPYLAFKTSSRPGDAPRKDFAVKRTFGNR